MRRIKSLGIAVAQLCAYVCVRVYARAFASVWPRDSCAADCVINDFEKRKQMRIN